MNKRKAIKYSKDFIIVDGHIDLPYRLYKEGLLFKKNINLNNETSGNFDIPKAKRGGLNCPFMAIYIPSEKLEDEAYSFANSLIDLVKNIIKYNDQFAPALNPTQVIENLNNDKISLPMGIENGSAIGNNLKNLNYFFNRGIRYITLTHAKNNQICDSSYDTNKKWNGLSDFGKLLINEMNNIGMMIDVSHVSDKTFYDILELTNKPLIASHSSPRNFTPGFERNMSDNMIKSLAENNGIIMINFGSSFINKKSNILYAEIQESVESWRLNKGYEINDIEVAKKREELIKNKNPFADLEDVLIAIDHVKNLVGDDFIGFGSDFDGLGDSLPNNLKNVSYYPMILEGLLNRGYSKESIEKICYKNLFRVWDTNLQNHQT